MPILFEAPISVILCNWFRIKTWGTKLTQIIAIWYFCLSVKEFIEMPYLVFRSHHMCFSCQKFRHGVWKCDEQTDWKKHKCFTLNVTNQAYRTQYICTQPYICTIHMLLWHVILQYIMLRSQPSVRFFLAPLTQMTWQCNDREKNISPGSVDCRWTGSFHANAALVGQLREMARHRSDQWFALLWCTCQLILSRPAHLCCNVFNLFMHCITADPKLWPLVLSGYWDGDRFLQRRRGV